MVKTETIIRDDGVKLIRYYSDINHKIRQVETGNIYEEAVDVESAGYTYDETDELIEIPIIPTYEGTNIIEVDTTIQPSNMEVQYYAKGV